MKKANKKVVSKWHGFFICFLFDLSESVNTTLQFI